MSFVAKSNKLKCSEWRVQDISVMAFSCMITLSILIILSGCISAPNHVVTTTLPATTTTLKQVNLSQEEIVEILTNSEIMSANYTTLISDETASAEIYHFIQAEGALVGGAVPFNELRHTKIDSANNRTFLKSSADLSIGKSLRLIKEVYSDNDLVYTRINEGNWTKNSTGGYTLMHDLSFKDIPPGDKTILEVKGMEEIGGEECYVLSVKTSGKNVQWLLKMHRLAQNAQAEDISVEEYTEWVSKTDLRIKKRHIKGFIDTIPALIEYTGLYVYDKNIELEFPKELQK